VRRAAPATDNGVHGRPMMSMKAAAGQSFQDMDIEGEFHHLRGEDSSTR